MCQVYMPRRKTFDESPGAGAATVVPGIAPAVLQLVILSQLREAGEWKRVVGKEVTGKLGAVTVGWEKENCKLKVGKKEPGLEQRTRNHEIGEGSWKQGI